MTNLLLELGEDKKNQARFAVARCAAAAHGGIQSWDLIILDADDNEISSDPFNFSGHFRQGDGLNSLVAGLLDESGLVYKGSAAWKPNEDESEWRTEIFRVASWFKPKG